MLVDSPLAETKVIDKLKQKRQSQAQQRQASAAVSAFYELLITNQSYSKKSESGQQAQSASVEEQNKGFEKPFEAHSRLQPAGRTSNDDG